MLGEVGEGLRTLAWVIYDGKKLCSVENISRIIELVDGLIDEDDMPPDFRNYGMNL